jgi:hypothetical protein
LHPSAAGLESAVTTSNGIYWLHLHKRHMK